MAIREPTTLDPMRIQDPGSVLIARQLYEGLTRWDGLNETVVPAAAESWEVQDGGRTFVFNLRPGMTFHDGTLVTAAAFRFAFDRLALKANASDLAYTLESVVGFAEVNQLGTREHLSGISAPDDLTLEIHLIEPYQDFPAVLTHPALVPLAEAAVADLDTFLSYPIGNGPFLMAREWTVGEEVVLRANPGFIQSPHIDGIRFLPYPDAAASWLQFLDGELDVVEVPAGQIDAAEEAFGSGGFKPFLAGYYYGVNLRMPTLQSMVLRKAISRAIDREFIASTIYKGTLEPARGIVPAGMPGFQENVCVGVCDYAPDAAAALVRRVPEGRREVTLEYTSGEPHDRVAKVVKENLEAVGLKVTIRAYDFPRFLKLLRSGKQHIYRLGWIAEYPTADVFLSALFESSSPDNHSGFDSAEVDRLLEEARAEPSIGKRVQLYIAAERAILKRLPVVPLGSFVTHWSVNPRVENLIFDVMGGFDAAEVSLATSE